jgi:hypothetical protein
MYDSHGDATVMSQENGHRSPSVVKTRLCCEAGSTYLTVRTGTSQQHIKLLPNAGGTVPSAERVTAVLTLPTLQ